MKNEKVYEYNADKFTAHANDIINLDLLDVFINDYTEAKAVYDNLENPDNFEAEHYNFFKNTDSFARGPSLAALTGIMYINNANGSPIDEARIKNYYHDFRYTKPVILILWHKLSFLLH